MIYAYIPLLETIEELCTFVELQQIGIILNIVYLLLKAYLAISIQICDQKCSVEKSHFP